MSFRATSFRIKIEVQTKLYDRVVYWISIMTAILYREECKLSLCDARNKRNDCQHKNAIIIARILNGGAGNEKRRKCRMNYKNGTEIVSHS